MLMHVFMCCVYVRGTLGLINYAFDVLCNMMNDKLPRTTLKGVSNSNGDIAGKSLHSLA